MRCEAVKESGLAHTFGRFPGEGRDLSFHATRTFHVLAVTCGFWPARSAVTWTPAFAGEAIFDRIVGIHSQALRCSALRLVPEVLMEWKGSAGGDVQI